MSYESRCSEGWQASSRQLVADVAEFPDSLVQVEEITALMREAENEDIMIFVKECFTGPALKVITAILPRGVVCFNVSPCALRY